MKKLFLFSFFACSVSSSVQALPLRAAANCTASKATEFNKLFPDGTADEKAAFCAGKTEAQIRRDREVASNKKLAYTQAQLAKTHEKKDLAHQDLESTKQKLQKAQEKHQKATNLITMYKAQGEASNKALEAHREEKEKMKNVIEKLVKQNKNNTETIASLQRREVGYEGKVIGFVDPNNPDTMDAVVKIISKGKRSDPKIDKPLGDEVYLASELYNQKTDFREWPKKGKKLNFTKFVVLGGSTYIADPVFQ